MAEWCNGSHNGLKIRWSQDRVGSSPTSATNKKISNYELNVKGYLNWNGDPPPTLIFTL